MHIGKLKHNINVAIEFDNLSKEDEAAAECLADKGHFRQACYFLIQSMEKTIRSKIFSLVNPNIEYFRERNKSHSVEDAAKFLIEIVSTDEMVRVQVSEQMNKYVLGNIKYSRLHNNLRYPIYFDRYNSYSLNHVDESDYKNLKKKLDSLKFFLKDLIKINLK